VVQIRQQYKRDFSFLLGSTLPEALEMARRNTYEYSDLSTNQKGSPIYYLATELLSHVGFKSEEGFLVRYKSHFNAFNM
jgi:hypothetical protein